MPLGTYEHPVYGTIEINPERVKRFADGVKAKVRGQDLDIDYDHKAKRDDAAGWVKDADARADGLWLLVEWTKEAAGKLKDKAYRYFSPEFRDEWEHPSTKQKFSDVLFGGALTNRPFLKGILPINLSEVFDSATHEVEEVGMDPKELRKQLGLPEDATDEQVTAKITELAARPEKQEDKKDDTGTGGGPGSGDTGAPEVIAASEELKKLSETNPAIKQLMETVTTQGTELAAQRKVLAEAAVDKQLSALDTDKQRLTPAARELTKNIMLGEDVAKNTVELLKLQQKGEAYAELGERHEGGDHGNHESTGATKFMSEVEKVLKDNDKLSIGDAVELVARKEPQMYEEYREAAYSFKV
jgi:hypothetical protein